MQHNQYVSHQEKKTKLTMSSNIWSLRTDYKGV